jgi:zinc transport system permease protein
MGASLFDKLQLFWASYDLWGGAVIAGMVAGWVCGFLGIYIILHRIVFVSAAMSEVSSLGVMVAFWLAQMEAVEQGQHTEDVLPLLFAALFTGIFAAAMAGQASARIADRSKSAETFIGAVYLLSTAGLIVIGDRVTQGAHDVANVLFGNTVVVDSGHLLLLLAVCIPVFLIHLVLKKDMLFISFDPVMASTLNYPVTLLRILLLVTLGIVISIGTRVIGALPVFSLSVLPAAACLTLFRDTHRSFWAAAIFGALSAFLGYLISFLFSFPTGACITLVAGGFLMFSSILRKLMR